MAYLDLKMILKAPDYSKDHPKEFYDIGDLLIALAAPKSKDNPKRSFDLGEGHVLDVHYIEKEEKGYPASIFYRHENKRDLVGAFIATGRDTDRYLIHAIHRGWTLCDGEPIFLLPKDNEKVIEMGRGLGHIKPKLDLVHNDDLPAE